MIRRARSGDLDSIAAIEEAAFRFDRFPRRVLRHLLLRANAETLVAVAPDGAVQGYAAVLFRRGARRARLYSIAVAPPVRGTGVGAALLAACEAAARARGMIAMRLEVRADDHATQRFYRCHRYHPFARLAGYYQDGMDAVRMEKPLG